MKFSKHKLGDLLHISRGASLPGRGYCDRGKYLRLTLANFFEEGGFKEFKSTEGKYFNLSFDPKFLMKKGDLITPLTEQSPGLLGSVAFIPCDNLYIQSQDVGLITCNAEKLDKQFAYYLFLTHSVREQISARSQQTKIRHTSPDKISDVEVFLPDLPTQLRIAGVLGSLDEKIELNRKKIAELEALAKTIYDYWFVQFDFPDANGKPYRSSGGKMVWNEQLKREIPDGWEVKTLGSVMSVNDESYSDKTLPNDINYIDISSVSCGTITSWTHYTKGTAPGRARRIAKDGDTIWSTVRPNLRAYALVVDPNVNNVYSTGFVVLRPQGVPFSFLYLTTTTDSYIEYLVSRVGNSAYPSVLPCTFEQYQIPLPSCTLLSCFSKITDSIFRAREYAFSEIKELSQTRDCLLPLLMNGQAKVAG